MRVIFVVHGSKKIGMGHIMRSLSLAEAFRERGHYVSFFSKYSLGIKKIKEYGFEIENTIFCLEEGKTENFCYGETKEAVQDAEYIYDHTRELYDIIIVDSYNVSKEFFLILKKVTRKLVYIDDLNAFEYPVDILINGSAAAFGINYEQIQKAQLLLGLSYNLIRKEFRGLPEKSVKNEVEDVLITTGNSDPFHMTEKIIDILRTKKFWKNITIHVIMGSGFESVALKEFASKDEKICLHEEPFNMQKIMLKCDLAITAGGSTIYELASCGVPAIVFAYADNQIPQIMALEKEGLLQYIGTYQNLDQCKMIQCIQSFYKNYNKRKELAEKLQLLVDAKGTLRIVKEIEKGY